MATREIVTRGACVAIICIGAVFSGCVAPAAKTAIDIIAPAAVDVLTRVIRDRFGSEVDKSTSVCWELPEGFQSGEEELDDEERGAFLICWSRAAD